MTEKELKQRTKEFAHAVLNLIDDLPDTRAARIISGQLGRAGTSVAANYRAACRSRSVAEMISKISVVEEEADESAFWLELIMERKMLPGDDVLPLHGEAGELTAIMVASRKTLLRRRRQTARADEVT